MNRTKHKYTITNLFWIVIDLMFDLEISLFKLSMWITIRSYLIAVMSRISFKCSRTYMSVTFDTYGTAFIYNPHIVKHPLECPEQVDLISVFPPFPSV